MGIILGFGSTEENFVKNEFDFIDNFIKQNIDKCPHFFTDELIQELQQILTTRQIQYDTLDKQYKIEKEHPERYSTFYFDILHNACNICIIFNLTHINRKHPFSEDGWAAFCETRIYHSNHTSITL